MRVSVEWLRDWVEVAADPQQLAASLTTAGLEVEEVMRAGPALDNVVVRAITAHDTVDEALSLVRAALPG